MQLAYTSLLPSLPSSLPSSLFLPYSQDFQQELYQLKDEFERYKMRAQSVLRSKGNKVRKDVVCSLAHLYHGFVPSLPCAQFLQNAGTGTGKVWKQG